MSILDIIIFLFFTGGVVVFGCSFFNKKRSSEEFTSAGRSLPGWVVGMSIFATYVSSISYLAYPGKAYMSDWNAFVFSLSIPIASYFAAKYFVPFYRSIGSVSAYSFLEERFGPWARVYASSCYLLTQVARMGSILYLLALPMNALLGWDIKMIIAVTSVAIIAYSMLGGLKAVIWTEAIQGFILIGGAVVCLCVLMFKMPEGPAQVFQIAVTDQKFSLGSFGSSLTESTFWVCLIYGIFINLQNYGIDQNYVQRYLTAKSDKQAKFSRSLRRLFVYSGFCGVLYDRYGIVCILQDVSGTASGRSRGGCGLSLFYCTCASDRTYRIIDRLHFCGGNEYGGYKHYKFGYYHSDGLLCPLYK